MTQIQNVTDYEIVTDNDLNEKDFKKPLLKNYLKEKQSSSTTIECMNVVNTNISKEHFKSLLTQVIKNKYIC